MKETADECPGDGCATCDSRVLDAAFGALYATIPAAVGSAAYAFFWDASWTPFWVAAGVFLAIQLGLKMQIWYLQAEAWWLRRLIAQRNEEIRRLQQQRLLMQQETLQLQILVSQRHAEIAQREAHISALRVENLEMERLLSQRRLEQEARQARQRLAIACAAVEADRLEAAAWRMELTAKQLELKLGQADLFESLSAIEDNAQDRIIAAYEQGFDHGKRGIVIPIKQLRHLRVVEESA